MCFPWKLIKCWIDVRMKELAVILNKWTPGKCDVSPLLYGWQSLTIWDTGVFVWIKSYGSCLPAGCLILHLCCPDGIKRTPLPHFRVYPCLVLGCFKKSVICIPVLSGVNYCKMHGLWIRIHLLLIFYIKWNRCCEVPIPFDSCTHQSCVVQFQPTA